MRLNCCGLAATSLIICSGPFRCLDKGSELRTGAEPFFLRPSLIQSFAYLNRLVITKNVPLSQTHSAVLMSGDIWSRTFFSGFD